MEILKGLNSLTCLKENIKIYVPSTIDGDINFDSSYFVQKISFMLAEKFGGYTSYVANGGWIEEKSKKLICEKVTVIQAFTNAINNNEIDFLIGVCRLLKKEMNQYCISLEINEKLYFVE